MQGGGPWWTSVVEVRGGRPWWRSVVEIRGGDPWIPVSTTMICEIEKLFEHVNENSLENYYFESFWTTSDSSSKLAADWTADSY